MDGSMFKKPPSHADVLEVLDYNPLTGILTWKVRTAKRIKIGDPAGSLRARGYLGVKVFGRLYLAHLLVWFWVHGEWPHLDIDHIDGDGSNNRLSNLRQATKSQNLANRGVQAGNKSGFKGVSAKDNKWSARIEVLGRRITLGSFDTPEKAHAAYIDAAKLHFGDFARAA